ncbi:MAG: CbiX/SirB N-terminal domain-containing protein [Eubacteriales bacterium]
MKGIIILAHGSREKSTESTLIQIVEMVKQQVVDYEIEYAFMEFSGKCIEVGLENLVAKGIKEIVAVPYFLFSGIHIREDIPEELAKFTEKHSDVTITMGQTLGVDERLAAVLVDRVKAAL